MTESTNKTYEVHYSTTQLDDKHLRRAINNW